MKFTALALTAGLLACAVAQAAGVQSLLQTYNCAICHADRDTKTGPAFVDVADKYRGNPQAVSILVAVVRKGVHGEGPWPMPPLPEVPPADAKRISGIHPVVEERSRRASHIVSSSTAS